MRQVWWAEAGVVGLVLRQDPRPLLQIMALYHMVSQQMRAC